MSEDLVSCPICGKRFKQLHTHLRRVHNIDPLAYRLEHPTCPMCSESGHILRYRKAAVTSSTQHALFQLLCALSPVRPVEEYYLCSMFIDIAFPEQKVAVELDGGYFHEADAKCEMQKRNNAYAEIKTRALAEFGWTKVSITDEEAILSTKESVERIFAALGVDVAVPDDVAVLPYSRTHCAHCDKQLTLKQIYSHKRFCGRACGRKEREACKSLVPCHVCGAMPTPLKFRKMRFCCTDHRDQVMQECRKIALQRVSVAMHNSEYSKQRARDTHVMFKCAYCGKETWTHRCRLKGRTAEQLFCSTACYHAAAQGRPRLRKGDILVTLPKLNAINSQEMDK